MSNYGYVRVSTKDQNEDRQWLALQEAGLAEECIYMDKQSGKDFDRPKHTALLKKLRKGDALMNLFREIFQNEKAIIAMLHLKTDSKMGMLEREIDIYYRNGIHMETPQEKIYRFRQLLGDFPFVVGAGVREDTVAETLAYSDGIIVGSWLKESHEDSGDVNEDYV